MREAGVLLHPTSLPGPGGIGSLGNEAYRFVDFLEAADQRLWQTLPLGPTGFGNSPYQCISAFAGNPLLISLERLVDQGLLDAHMLSMPEHDPRHVDFEAVQNHRKPLLAEAYRRFKAHANDGMRAAFEAFCAREASWLEDFVLFNALYDAHNSTLWTTWPEPVAQAQPEALEQARHDLAEAIDAKRFEQFVFFDQWTTLKHYANQRGITIIGDIPIFVALNSADVWARRELFLLNPDGQPEVVAGVPPDYFSKTGQRWGNPLYNWEALKATGYAWWLERFKVAMRTTDLVRVDHFRGFEAYWAVPAEEETAINGEWRPGPGHDFFETLKRELGDVPVIAEDLGVITPGVEALRDDFALPGMKILQFSFGEDPFNPFMPHNYEHARCVVYPGTHDNDTSVGWYHTLPDHVGHHVRTYLEVNGDDIAWDLIKLAWASVAGHAIVTAQDLLSLDTEHRMNTPGVASGNWTWRLLPGELTSAIGERLKTLTVRYGRIPNPKANKDATASS